jgi:hypothetical protein
MARLQCAEKASVFSERRFGQILSRRMPRQTNDLGTIYSAKEFDNLKQVNVLLPILPCGLKGDI